MNKIILSILSLITLLLTGCNNGDSGLQDLPTSTGNAIASLIVEPQQATTPVGLSIQMQASAVMTNGQVVNVTDLSTIMWRSSNDQVASVSNQSGSRGSVRALAPGSVIITAQLESEGELFEATTTLTVTESSAEQLLITPENSSLPIGFEKQFSAQVVLSDDQVIDVTQESEITWEVSDPTVASISNQAENKGLLTGLRTGKVTVTASGTINGRLLETTTELTVTNAVVSELLVEPQVSSITVGLEKQFTAKAVLSDGQVLDVTEDSSLNWHVSDSSIASVSNEQNSKGMVKSLQAGTVRIIASGAANGKVFEASAMLTIGNAEITQLLISPTKNTLPIGMQQQLKAEVRLSNGQVVDVTEDSAISWRVNEPTIASVSNQPGSKGLVTGLLSGEVTVSASGTVDGKLFEASAIVEVTNAVVAQLLVSPQCSSLAVGLQTQFKVEAIFTDGQILDVTQDDAIHWQSSDTSIATVSNTVGSDGLVSALKSGEVVISASGTANGHDFTASATLTVTDVMATKLLVTPANSLLPVGLDQQFNAQMVLSNNQVVDVTNDEAFSWRVSDSNVASVSNDAGSKGQVHGLSPGVIDVIASGTVNGHSFEASAELEVTNAVVKQLLVTPQNSTLPIGLEQQYSAQAVMSNGQVLDVTQDSSIHWRVTDTNIASVGNADDSKGLVKGLQSGDVTIIASGMANGQAFEASSELTVTNAEIKQLLVTPANSSVPVGLEHQFNAQVVLSNNQVIDVTNDAAINWRTSNSDVAVVSNAADSKGVAQGLLSGRTEVIASGSVNGQIIEAKATLDVTNAVVTQLMVTPQSSSLAIGLEKQYTAQAIFSNGQVVDVTQDAAISWQSSDDSVATVSSDPGTKGTVQGLKAGEVTITASGIANEHEFEASATLTVIKEEITQLLLTPVNSSIPAGLALQYSAQALFSNGRVQDVTDDASIHWQTSDNNIAIVSNNAGTRGQVKALLPGEVEIIASAIVAGKEFESSVTLTVTDTLVTQLLITPANGSLPVGLEKQFSAQVVLSNNQVIDVTNDDAISWRVSDSTIASVGNTTSTKGIVKGLQSGTVTVIASGEANGRSFEASALLEVTDAIVTQLVVTPHNHELSVGLEQQYSAQAIFSDGQILDVTNDAAITWSVSDSSIASFDNTPDSKGVIKGLQAGEVTVTASGILNRDLIEATTTLTVSNVVVTKLIIDPIAKLLPVGMKQQFSVKAMLSNDQIIDVTNDSAISWRVTNPSIASVGNDLGSNGMVEALNVGEVGVVASGSANGQTFEAYATVTVVEPIIQEIILSTQDVMLVEYHNVQLRAYAYYSNGVMTDVTSLSVWNAGDSITAIGGLLIPSPFIKDYKTTVSATYEGVTSSDTTVTMIEAHTSPVIGRETAYTSDISSSIYPELSFKGSAVLDGIYDPVSGELLAGGYGGSLNPTDAALYGDHMLVNDVTYISGKHGTEWPGGGGKELLQFLEWNESSASKNIGKFNKGTVTEVTIEDRILGIVVYSTAAVPPRYVTGIQFVYR